jgi:hypothetical protein
MRGIDMWWNFLQRMGSRKFLLHNIVTAIMWINPNKPDDEVQVLAQGIVTAVYVIVQGLQDIKGQH